MRLITAVTKNYGIGYRNQLPWHKFPIDMNFFKKTTTNHTVLMGHNTFKSMNCKGLPNRNNYIVASDPTKILPTNNNPCYTFNNMNDAYSHYNINSANKDMFVIGGAKLYQECLLTPSLLNKITTIYMTYVDIDLPTDTSFPYLAAKDFYLKNVIQSGTSAIFLHKNTDSLTDTSTTQTPTSPLSEETKYEILEYAKLDKTNQSNKAHGYQGEQGYLDAVMDIIKSGEERSDRTGTGTKALFGLNFRYDLTKGFPLLTTKKMFTRGIIEELLWFLRGETNAKILQDKGVKIWDGNSSREYLDSIGLTQRTEGELGPVYGFMFRHFGAEYSEKYNGVKPSNNDSNTDNVTGFDQVQYVLDKIRNNPYDRRIIISLWNPNYFQQQALPACHVLYQFWVSACPITQQPKYLSCSLYQRSGDMGLGIPFNVASASIMTHIFAKLTGLVPKEFVHTIGDAHVYNNHITALIQECTERIPRPFPIMQIKDNNQKTVEDFKASDFQFFGYHPYPAIKMDMAV
jgi:dihydrofolate reductase/thymidylate synthase